MAQVQEQRYYICKICNKECLSGKSLGGHMRSHLPLISASKKAHIQPKCDKKVELQDPDFVDDDDDDDDGEDDQSNSAFPGQEKIKNRNINPELNNPYELRDDPKKSWKISGTENGFSSKGFSCKECGKEFLTLRAVSGHMRCHSTKNVKGDHQCKECGKSFDSLRAMYGHMKTHSKRVKVIDNEISSTTIILELDDLCPVRKKRSRIRYNSNITSNPSFSSLNESTSVVSEFEEVKLAAKSLIMLSRGVKDLIGLNSVTESSSDDDSIYFDFESSSESKKIYGNVNLLNSETEKIVSHEFDDADVVVMMDSSLLSVTEGDSMSLESRKSKEHECSICFKVFPSGRALGGHKRAHYYTTKTKEAMNVNQDVGEDIDLNFPVHNLWWAETTTKSVNGHEYESLFTTTTT